MSGSGYKVLGFVVWQGAKWFAKRRVGQMLPSRRTATAGIVVLGIAAIAVAAARDNE